MKKKILISVFIILYAFLLMTGCSSKQSDKNTDTTTEVSITKTEETVTIKAGRYFGEPYSVTSSFLPILTLEDGNKFKFEIKTSTTIEGTYKIDNNKLVLTSSDQAETYKFSITDKTLIIEEEIPNWVKKNSGFRLAEQYIFE